MHRAKRVALNGTIIASTLMLCLTVAHPANAFFLPDTGQTTCYGTTGKAIACPLPGDSLAQDGSYAIIPPSYTANSDGTVFDNNSWLMWQQQDDSVTRNRNDATTYCENLTLGGHEDWRLPTKKELVSIVHYGKFNPTIDSLAFPNTKVNNYWTLTPYAADSNQAWMVSFGNGAISNAANTSAAYTRCVRGGPLEYGDLYSTAAGVIDKSTELMWTGNITSARGSYTMIWGDALAACENLAYGAYSDWRLPNVTELESLTDDLKSNPSLDSYFFSDVSPAYYWTSTTDAASTAQSWAISFQDSTAKSVKKGERSVYVRCVRSEQKSVIDPQEIKTSPSYLDFGHVKKGESNNLDLTISNAGREVLSIESITSPSAPFSVINDGCSGRSLSVWESCVLTVNFQSTSAGISTGAINIMSNDSDTPNMPVEISATVTTNSPAFLLPDTSLQFCFKSLYPLMSAWFYGDCGGPPLQDGSYNINGLVYNFSGSDVATDVNTGLMWQRIDDGAVKTWGDAVDYCNSSNLGGYTGWRLPSRTELFSIIDDSHKGDYTETGSPKRTLAPKIYPWAFPGTQAADYWTSSESEESKALVWNVSFVYGTSELVKKDTSLYTRCVRGGGLPTANLLSNGNGTLTDKSTSHMWQQGEGGEMTWTNAANYCEGLSLGGYSDWRLPNVKELEYISKANKEAFPAIQSSGYWSSTTNMYSKSFTWVDSFDYAYVVVPHAEVNERYRGFGDGEAVAPVRCVRGGNPSLLKMPVIMASPSSLNFGSIDAGTSSSQSFYLWNIGSGSLVIGTISAPSAPFSITSDGCSGRALSASMSCAVTVKFASVAAGNFTDNIAIPSSDTAQPSISVGLNGTATLPSAVITGIVTDSSGTSPLPGVAVSITDAIASHTATTGSNGIFTISGLAQGSYTATFAKSGYVQQTLSGSLNSGEMKTVNARLSLIPPLAITITSPQEGATLNASTVTITGTVSNNAAVKVNGVQATVGNGAFSASIPLTEGQNPITADATDSYGQTASHRITVTLLTKGTIIGTVTDSAGVAVASAKVTVTDSLSVVQTVYTDASGNYTVPNVSQGQYTLSITLDDYSTYSFSGSLTAGDTAAVNGSITLQAPAITAVSVSNITGYSATITWTTDQQASSTVEYGTTTAYGSSASDPTLATSHSITINNLTPGTTYHYSVASANSHSLSSTSTDSTFTTLSPPAISAVAVTGITTGSATITWTTDQPSNSAAAYGTTTDYGSTASDPTMTTTHSITLTNLNMQTQYHFSVSSTNSYGLTSSSADSVFTTKSPIAVTISSPVDGATIKRPDIMVKGAITNTTGNETGVTVNGVVATVYGGTFVANHVPLTEGSNTITVTATDTAGYTATTSITITAVTTGNYITLLSNIDSGISALEPTLRIDGYADGTTPTLSYLGPGSVDWTNCTSYEACRVKMTTEGIYYFTATGTGTDGNEYQDTTAVTVLSRTEVDALLKAKWEGMKAVLMGGDIETALTYFVEVSQDRYRQAFATLGSDGINSRFSSITDLKLHTLYGRIGQCWAVREESQGTFAYPVTFVKNGNGVWQIRGF